MDYKISYLTPTSQYIPIEAYIDCDAEDELMLQFPAWRPGRYELANFAKNVKNFAAWNETDQKIAVKKTGKDTWLVDCKNTAKIKVTYYYYAAELNAGSTFMDDQQLYVNPVNCLVYVKEKQTHPCKLELVIPANFEIACGAELDGTTLLCEDFHELVDSPFIASANLQHKTYKILGITFHLWFQGNVIIDWEKVLKDFKKFTKAQLEVFSNRSTKFVGFPVKNYHFIYQIPLIKGYHGVEHKTSTVIALGPAEDLMGPLYDDFLGISSHELYHVWNIKTIRPKEMYPYDYSKENFSELGYIAEGVTTYLGDVFLAKSGVKDFEWYTKELEKLFMRHFANFGRFNYSVAESSWDTWLDGYVKGSPFRKVSIYNEGALLAFVMDMKIRLGSANKKSIHNVMEKLYHDFALKGIGYTEQDYKTACEHFSGEDLTSFFEDYVHGNHPYESILMQAIETVGFELRMKRNPNLTERILGLKTVQINEKEIITDIFPGSSGDFGQLIIGDEIVALNQIPIKSNLNEVLKPIADIPLDITINRAGRKLDLICPNTNRAFYPIYYIEKGDIPSNLSKSTFRNWIGSKWHDC